MDEQVNRATRQQIIARIEEIKAQLEAKKLEVLGLEVALEKTEELLESYPGIGKPL